jgi:hypothetical protein
MSIQIFKTIRVLILGFPFGNPEKKCHLDVALTKNHRVYYKEGSGASSPKVAGRVKLVLEVVLTKFATPLAFNLH